MTIRKVLYKLLILFSKYLKPKKDVTWVNEWNYHNFLAIEIKVNAAPFSFFKELYK